MTVRRVSHAGNRRRSLFLLGASMVTLAAGLGTMPAHAQSVGALLGGGARAPRPASAPVTATPARTPSMQAALARQQSSQSRATQIRAYANAVRGVVQRIGASEGLSENGLDPIEAVREAMAASRAGDTRRADELLVSVRAANDASGLKSWEGAGLPTQTTVDGRTVVTINQTQERALLSWNSFNIGENTTLQFSQKQNGAAKPDWVAVNRVTNATNPSLILGNMKADGTVVVLNQAGIIFGAKSQINTHSLLASTLELGNGWRRVTTPTSTDLQGLSVADRNRAFLSSGLFAQGNGSLSKDVTDSTGPGVLVSAPITRVRPQQVDYANPLEGDVVVDRGAQISAGKAGFVVLAAPAISVSGAISAVDGQVSLQAGRIIPFSPSTGSVADPDPYVRGFKLNTYQLELPPNPADYVPQAGDGRIFVDGAITSRRGYLSLGTGVFGSVRVDGYLESTTSVSRNGKIALLSGNVTLGGSSDQGRAAGIAMLADETGETIPQGSAANPTGFKSSQLVIGTQIANRSGPMFDLLGSTNFTMGTNALIYAPNADVAVGKPLGDPILAGGLTSTLPGRIDIGAGARIDVAGIKDVQRAVSDHIIAVTPVKRNELSDTPNYREVAIGDNFSLNGATLYIDSRVSGVRADGVAWVGSPLIQGGSLASQIPATASELMTKGGSVTLATIAVPEVLGATVADAPRVHIARDAVIDVSGGWVNYAGGTVRTSRLLTDDGRIVDIGRADPNDRYVAVVEGTTSVQPRFGVVRNYLSAASQSTRYEASYDEGRDAGSLAITTAAATIDGSIFGNAFAGSRQLLGSLRPSLKSSIAGDPRLLQRAASELPAGGAVAIRSLGDTIVYRGVRGSAALDGSELLLNDAMLNAAGLSALSLTAAGSITFAGNDVVSLAGRDAFTISGASDLQLAPGGTLTALSGRSIRFDGKVTAPSGSIIAKTELAGVVGTDLEAILTNGSGFRTGLYGQGNGDDIAIGGYQSDPGEIRPFDIVVTGALSTAGLWVNDYLDRGQSAGSAFQDGGTISLTSARKVLPTLATPDANGARAIDLSGSIVVRGSLDVSAGGYVNSAGKLSLGGRGGNVSLVNATIYGSIWPTWAQPFAPEYSHPFDGPGQSIGNAPVPRSTVDLSGATITGFGFAGGGTFALTAPDLSFGSDRRTGSTHIGLDFLANTGFGTLSLTSTRSRIVDSPLANRPDGKSAFLETTRITIGAGETLDLTQWVLPSILTSDQANGLRGLASGTRLLDQPWMAPIKPGAAWDQRGASLVLGGLTELDVMAGGTITGAPQASITASKLYNAGRILLHGGTIRQRNDLPADLIASGLGVRDPDLGGKGLGDAFGGGTDALGRFDGDAVNAAGVRDAANTRLLTNAELVSLGLVDRLVYFLGMLDAGQGVVLAAGSQTDLSGMALYDPRARLVGGAQLRSGRVIGGGSISLASGTTVGRRSGGFAVVGTRRSQLSRDDAAVVNISGATGLYDQALGGGFYAPYQEWSAAGTISALGGGTLGTTPILARGGVAAAEGGTLEWLNPTLGSATAGAANYLSADMISRSGFDTVIARGGLTLDGDFLLPLRKALRVISADPLSPGVLNSFDSDVAIGATKGTNAKVVAGHVQFASRNRSTSSADAAPAQGTGDANIVFVGGAQGIDFSGGITFGNTIGNLAFKTPGDIRFIGVNDASGVTSSLESVFSGGVAVGNNVTFDAYRTYATTGTGNLQALLEGSTDRFATAAYTIIAPGTITIGNSYLKANTPTPLSAGTHLVLAGRDIVQNGYLAAPLGLLELGRSWTRSVRFGAGSVTTVSGEGLTVPYGTSIDGTEYYFPTRRAPITRLPTGELRLAAGSIVQEAGAAFEGRGGGDVFGYQFQPGVGGSRDVLDRFNRDEFSANGFDPATGQGYQYADQRQVFALVPVSQASGIAAYDPVFSADYGASGPIDLYGTAAGRTVILDAAPGVAAGEYLLVPAKYAVTIPGALRVVENADTGAPIPGQGAQLLDGSVVVGGRYAAAGTGIEESTRRSFTVQSKDVFSKYSTIKAVSGTTTITEGAIKAGVARPRAPLDAARVVLSPLNELRLAGAFNTSPATGGSAGQFDLTGSRIVITTEGDTSSVPTGVLRLTDTSLNALNAPSLFIGGTRSGASDGTTVLNTTTLSVEVRQGATLRAAELLLGVGGAGSTLTVADGATLVAAGTLGAQSSGDYALSTAGSLLRVATGGERLVSRSGTGSSTLQIGAATLRGDTVVLDSSGAFLVSDDATLAATRAALSGTSIRFDASAGAVGQPGVIGAGLEAKLANAQQLTIRSQGAIRFSAGAHRFNDLVLDSASIGLVPGAVATDALRISAGNVALRNQAGASDGCATSGFCGIGGSLAIEGTTIAFGANAVRANGFANGVSLAGRDGMYFDGKGSFSSGNAALTLIAPFLADRSSVADPRAQSLRPDYSFLTSGDFVLTAQGANAATAPTGNATPGARLGIGASDARVASARIEGALVRATAGVIDIQSAGDIGLVGATLSTPGYLQSFGDKEDPVIVSANGGTVNLLSARGNIRADAASNLVVDSGTGAAGTLNVLAGRGSIALDAAINPAATGSRAASLNYDSGTAALDLTGFVARYGRLFGGDVSIRTGAGDLNLAAGNALKAKSVALTADGGAITIAGTIDTSGVNVAGMNAVDAANARVNGGDISLWGMDGVTLAGGALLDTHTHGYADKDSRVATAGDVTIGIGRDTAALTITSGAVIDAGARRTQSAIAAGLPAARLIPETITDSATGQLKTVYRYADPDTGGTVHLRAPVIGTGGNQVAVSLKGAIQGAGSVELEGYTRYDLDSIANSGLYAGVTRGSDGTLLLDFGKDSSNSGGKRNPFTQDFMLADGSKSMVRFIRDFAVSAVDGSDLRGIRLRPGVELGAAAGVKTVSQWNLAAATFSEAQLQSALAAGDLAVIPELSVGGQTRYSVVSGREGDLLDNHASFLYRVGGAARGEAPVLTFRAGGNLTIDRSISDGFFTFRDKSDPAYINFQMGGGNRTIPPTLNLQCGSSGNCGQLAPYQATGTPSGSLGTVTINLSSMPVPSAQTIHSPLAIAGNGAAGGGEGQDSLGFAELFPLLAGDVGMRSSDLRLVGGAGTMPSANPLQVDRGLSAGVTVSGSYSYALTATRGTTQYGGKLQFGVRYAGISVGFDVGDTFGQTDGFAGLNQISPNAHTQLNWGATAGLGADARAAALAWFAGKSYRLVGSNPATATGIVAPLSDITAFLQSFEPTYQAGLASRRSGYPAAAGPALVSYGAANRAYVRSYVRSGDGDIAVAAAGNIDLRGTAAPEYRQTNGTLATQPGFVSAGQFGSAAIYTAGVRIAQAQVAARVIGSSAILSLLPDSPYFAPSVESRSFLPTPTALTDARAAFASGGGDVRLDAGIDVLARRDSWTDAAINAASIKSDDSVGTATQNWRVGSIGTDTESGVAARYFTSGVGALAGGDVRVRAGRDIVELTTALDSSLTTTLAGTAKTLLTFGRGDLSITAGRDLLAGLFDISSGAARIDVGRDIAASGIELGQFTTNPANLRVRLSDATVAIAAKGSATLNSVSALGVQSGSIVETNGSLLTMQNAFLGANAAAAGFFSPLASLSLQANGGVAITQTSSGFPTAYGVQPLAWRADGDGISTYLQVLPPSLNLTSLSGGVQLGLTDGSQMLYPSAHGQLNLLSQRSIANLSLAMSDADPGLLPGAWDVSPELAPFRLPAVSPQTLDAELRYQHSQSLTHLGDPQPVRIYTNGDLINAALFLPKQARVTAGNDIVNLFFQGQNLLASDITRVRAGGDIRGEIGAGLLPYVRSNNFILGGPGTLIVEAGGDIGPFLTSANVRGIYDGRIYSFGGGIRTVGNDLNPWLDTRGADVSVRFGMTQGADYAALRETYLNPANFGQLDGDLFVQTIDGFGNQRPDRSKPVYLPKLAQWLRDHDAAAFAAIFGTQPFASDAALADAAYAKGAELYAAFGKVDPLRQQDFLVKSLLFGEIAAVGDLRGPSFQQYIRGYRAIQALFPTRLGYTDNLAPYTIDPATISAEHPLGEPVRNVVNGQPAVANRVRTGNLDLRLATIQTARGGDVSILGPGGDMIAGSTIRTADQPSRRETGFSTFPIDRQQYVAQGTVGLDRTQKIVSIPLGYEGILTLQGGGIHSFTDGDVTLNQSRVFTQRGGNISMWSSNGDLAAGQGPKTASSFPPVTVRIDEEGYAEVNSAGSVSGAGIGTFKASPDDPAADVILIAPVGTVDAGDAGVRASGNVVVAAARVANADNFTAAGTITGVPTSTATVSVVPAADPSRDLRNLARQAAQTPEQRNPRIVVTIEVLGPVRDGVCPPGGTSEDPDCSK